MEWKKYYLDIFLIPLGLVMIISYYTWLWYKVRTKPLTTLIGLNSIGRRLWVSAMIKDIDKKNLIAIQTLRNSIMGSTVMATTSVLICTGLAAVISSTYSIKKPLDDMAYAAHGELAAVIKYAAVLTLFICSFFCHTLSITFLTQVSLLICGPTEPCSMLTVDYLCELLERGSVLNTIGNRLFYTALPMLLWIFGPVLVLLTWAIMVPLFNSLDFFNGPNCGRGKGKEVLGSKSGSDVSDEEVISVVVM